MRTVARYALIVVAAAAARAFAQAPADVELTRAPLRLEVSTQARALQPGELVLVRARTSAPVDSVTGSSSLGSLRFFRTSDPLAWEALLGLDLAVKPGPYTITITAATPGGSAAAAITMRVLAKTFPSRRITVDPKFLNPPASELPRIEREAKLLAEVLAKVSAARAWSTPFVAPVPGPPTSGFGRVSVINGVRRTPHVGTDFKAAVGTPVRAPAAGTVVLSESLYYAGDAVLIDHGLGFFSMLVHLSERRTQAGDAVEAGEVIGLSGATGRITGPHLHWTARLGSARIDPMSVLAVLGERAAGESR